jgi:membrane protein required for colicin V production
MILVDLLILAAILVSVISAFHKGLLVELFSLVGVVLGLLIAAADYVLLAPRLMRWAKNTEVADLGAFLLIALGVMLVAGLIGRSLRGTIRWVGLGFLDRLLGAVFGFVEGCAVVTLVVMATAAFLPDASWLKSSRLVPLFLAAAHDGSHMTPFELGERIREGIQQLRMTQRRWETPVGRAR